MTNVLGVKFDLFWILINNIKGWSCHHNIFGCLTHWWQLHPQIFSNTYGNNCQTGLSCLFIHLQKCKFSVTVTELKNLPWITLTFIQSSGSHDHTWHEPIYSQMIFSVECYPCYYQRLNTYTLFHSHSKLWLFFLSVPRVKTRHGELLVHHC